MPPPKAAHAAAAAHHLAHHVAAHVGEAHAAGAVVAVGDDGELGAVREAADHAVAGVTPVVHVVLLGRNVVADAAGDVAEDTVHHALLHGEVDDGLVIAVVDAGELGLLGLLLHDLHLLDHLRGKVLGSELGIVQEEGLAVDGDLRDGLAVRGDGTVVIDLDARELLEEVDEHVGIRGLERGGVVLDRILLDDDRVARRGDRSGVQDFLVQVHLDHAQVQGLFPDFHGLLIGLVAHDLGLHGVLAGLDLLDDGLAVMVGQRVLGIALFGGEGNGREADGLSARGILQFHSDVDILGHHRQRGEQADQAKQNPSCRHKNNYLPVLGPYSAVRRLAYA